MNNVTAAYQMIFIIAICVLLPITMALAVNYNKRAMPLTTWLSYR